VTIRTTRSEAKFVAIALSLFLLPETARAQLSGLNTGSRGLIHKVSDKGEGYEDLAELYYGKRYLSLHLRVFNNRPEPLQKGVSINIPTFNWVAVKRGQTLAQFAEQYLFDPGRADYLAELHNLKGRDRIAPKPGMRIKVVDSLKHVVHPGETLRSIARLYYRDASSERLRLIILYNKLASGNVKSGMSLRIPLDGNEFSRDAVIARAKKPFDKSQAVAESDAGAEKKTETADKDKEKTAEKERPEKEKRAPAKRRRHEIAKNDPKQESDDDLPKGDSPAPEAEKIAAPIRHLDDELENLERLCGDGEYRECDERGRQVLAQSPSAAVSGKVEILHLRAVALVALGRIEESKSVFKQLLKLDPEYDLDLYRTSPKVLDVFQAVAER
jgi:hypothetical protein